MKNRPSAEGLRLAVPPRPLPFGSWAPPPPPTPVVAVAREVPEDTLYSPVLGPSGATAARAAREGLRGGRLGALRVRVKGLGVEKYNDGFEMNEAFIKSKVIAMIVVNQEDTNLALNLQIMTKSADLNSDDLVSYVAANENMAKAGKRLMAMNRVDEASHNHEAPHNLALKARDNHGSKEDYEIEEDEEMTSTSDIATDFAFFAKKYKAKFPMLLNDKKKKKRTCYNCDEDSHFANECPYEKRVDKPKFIKGVKPRLKPNPIND
ncbi:hypothetical protein QYE76_036015 [Lolium multiflorum]|uniref:CCHC-type domain-containing protein n=1 Tax=Lolium multiflorum TaxID=4521 RepID=A0AAD8R1Z6_LOLMU|nr:hypothetical protein QYE76_036015 [Lolium multiflorum]